MILQRMTAAGSEQVMLSFEDGTTMRVPIRTVADCGLFSGMELDENDLAAVQAEARRDSAKARAMRIVSSADISERELRRRLIQKGEEPADAEAAVYELRQIGAVDDAALAVRLAASSVRKGYGLARARQMLIQKGITRTLIDEALSDYPDMSEAIDRYLQRRLGGEMPDRRETARVTAALQRQGHSYEDISSAFRRYGAALEETD